MPWAIIAQSQAKGTVKLFIGLGSVENTDSALTETAGKNAGAPSIDMLLKLVQHLFRGEVS